MTDTREQLLNDLSQRAQAAETQLAATQTELAALRDTLSPDNLRTFVSDYLGGLTDSDPLVRKMRFGGESASLLIGSKFTH